MMDAVSERAPVGALALRVVGTIRGDFVMPGYQRGYRWTAHEVGCLLDDLWENRGGHYCLQPVVVKRLGDDRYELVDGQQRLTTLYLLAAYLRHAGLADQGPAYTIAYTTRPKSEAFLRALPGGDAGENIDFFHMSRAWACIARWFDARPVWERAEVATALREALATRVSVIWYEAPPDVDAITLFARLNAGRIPLTSAELLKAVLLSRGRGALARPEEVAAQWDAIERELRDPDLWAFVSNGPATSYPTRIGLLFELLVSAEVVRSATPYTVFDAHREDLLRDRGAFWRRVLALHATLREWFEDHDLYHHIGYLISLGTPLRALWEESQKTTRRQFLGRVRERIRRGIERTPTTVRRLRFDTDDARCMRVLQLANVEAVRRREPKERYPFRAHKAQTWSLEHVNPQSGDAVRTVDARRQWLRDHRAVLATLPPDGALDEAKRAALLSRIERAVGQESPDDFVELARDIADVFTADASLHEIGNLALLAKDDNSALSNAVFDVKQRRVIELDGRGRFVPVCTLRLFLKYYSPPEARRLPRWNPADREGYLDALFHPKTGFVAPWLDPEVAP